MPSATQIRYLTNLAASLDPYISGGGGGTDAEVVRDIIGAVLVAGANITITVNDAANTITIDASGGSGLTHSQTLTRGLGA